MTTTNETTLAYLAETATDWRAVVRTALAIGASAQDCWDASDAAWDGGNVGASRMLARAAHWFSETPSERRASRAFPAPDSVGTDPVSAHTDGLLGGQSILGGRPSLYR